MKKDSKASLLRDKTVEELVAERESLQRGLFNLRMQKATGRLEKPHQFKESRKEIARINTIINEKTKAGE